MQQVALAALQAWLPDSPRWLLLSGAGSNAAAAALSRVKGKYGQDAAALAREVQSVQGALEEVDGNAQNGVLNRADGRQRLRWTLH
jgi:hypothetical protein